MNHMPLIAIGRTLMTKVYIITSGEYSDYRINAVFLDHEKALLYVERANGDNDRWQEYGIEEWDANEEVPFWGTVYSENAEIFPDQDAHFWASGSWYEPIDKSGIEVRISEGNNRIFVSVKGVDEQRVKKVLSERVANVRAEYDIILRQIRAGLHEKA
jgi:hypothetical protein